MEADFEREYGEHLGDALWGSQPTGMRRLWALISGLPADSNTMDFIRRDDEEAQKKAAARNYQPALRSLLFEDMTEQGTPGGNIVMGA